MEEKRDDPDLYTWDSKIQHNITKTKLAKWIANIKSIRIVTGHPPSLFKVGSLDSHLVYCQIKLKTRKEEYLVDISTEPVDIGISKFCYKLDSHCFECFIIKGEELILTKIPDHNILSCEVVEEGD